MVDSINNTVKKWAVIWWDRGNENYGQLLDTYETEEYAREEAVRYWLKKYAPLGIVEVIDDER